MSGGLRWVQVETAFLSGPTLRRIAKALGVHRQHAVGMFADLWAWAQEHAPDGVVHGPDAADIIEEAAEWAGERGAFVSAALAVGPEESPFAEADGGLRLRGMDRYARALHRRMKEAERKRTERAAGAARPQDISRTSAGQSQDSARTSCGRPADVLPTSVALSPSSSSSVVSKGGVGENDGPPLGEALGAVFREEKGCDYLPNHADEQALRALLPRGREEVLRRWRLGLRRARYPSVATWAELLKHWNHCGKEDETPKSFAKPPVRDFRASDYHEGGADLDPHTGKPLKKAGGAS